MSAHKILYPSFVHCLPTFQSQFRPEPRFMYLKHVARQLSSLHTKTINGLLHPCGLLSTTTGRKRTMLWINRCRRCLITLGNITGRVRVWVIFDLLQIRIPSAYAGRTASTVFYAGHFFRFSYPAHLSSGTCINRRRRWFCSITIN